MLHACACVLALRGTWPTTLTASQPPFIISLFPVIFQMSALRIFSYIIFSFYKIYLSYCDFPEDINSSILLDRRKIEAVEMDYLRRDSRVSRLERVRNDVIRERINRKETVIEDIKRKQL